MKNFEFDSAKRVKSKTVSGTNHQAVNIISAQLPSNEVPRTLRIAEVAFHFGV
jgi:hypothetical protein